MQGMNQEFVDCAVNYLIGDKYEQQRKIRRQKIWKEICANKFKIEHF